MNKLLSKSLFLGLSSLVFSSVMAASYPGAYVEANVGESAVIWNTPEGAFEDEQLGLNFNLGYQFTRYFAGEVGYTQGLEDDYGFVNVFGKLILPLSKSFSVNLKLGSSMLISGDTHSEAFLNGGIGAAYALTQNLDLNVQAICGFASGGLTYHFS